MKKFSCVTAFVILCILSGFVSASGWSNNQNIADMNAHIYIPETTADNGKRPLMITLHGCNRDATKGYIQNIDEIRDLAKWEVAAEKHGMVVVVPEATHSSNCWNYYGDDQARDEKENDNILDLVKAIKNGSVGESTLELNIDPKQVYISGLGGGGSQAMVIACVAPDVFAGVGAVAAPTVGSDRGDELLLDTTNTTESAAISTCRSFAGENKQFFESQIASFIYGKTIDEAGFWFTTNDATDDYISNKYSILNADVMASIFGADKISEFDTNEVDGVGDEVIWKDDDNFQTVSLIYVDGMTHGWPAAADPVTEEEEEVPPAIAGERIVTGFVDYTTYLTDWLITNNRRINTNIAPVVEIELNKVSSDSIELTGTVRDDGAVEEIKVTVTNELTGGEVATATLTGADINDDDEFEYTASGLAKGAYIFKVVVSDDEDRVTTRESFEVLGDTLNIRPTVSISSEREQGVGCISLSGSAQDSDGELAAVLVKFDDVDGKEITRSAVRGANGSWKISQCGIEENFASGSVYALDNLGSKGAAEYFDIKLENKEGSGVEETVNATVYFHQSEGRINQTEADAYTAKYGYLAFDLFRCTDGDWTDEEDDCGIEKTEGVNLALSIIAQKISSALGEDVAFDVVVANFGTEDAKNVMITIELDDEYAISTTAFSCEKDDDNAKKYECSLGVIGDESEKKFELKIEKSTIGLVTVDLSADSSQSDTDATNNSAAASSWVVGTEYSLVISEDGTLVTTRAGGTDNFDIALGKQPTDDVVIRLISSDEERGTVTTDNYITFTPSNWNIPQQITVKGNDKEELDDEDEDEDKNKTYEIEAVVSNSQTDDANFHDLSVTVMCVNLENAEAGISIVKEGDLLTTETGGNAAFSIKLNTPPKEDVTVPLTSSKSSEGKVSPNEIVFTPKNWNQARTIIVTGQDDNDEDGDKAYSISIGKTISTDAEYNNLSTSVAVINLDNDTAGLRFITGTEEEDFETSEEGQTATFKIVLNMQPLADVIISLESSNKDEGLVSPADYTFTTENWNTPQTVTVNGVNDQASDGDVSYFVFISDIKSTDSDYNNLNEDDEVALVNIDDDLTAGLVFVAGTNLQTSEEGDEETFSVRLTKQPSADVTIGFRSEGPSEGQLLTSSITFTADNWDTLQIVTVKGVDDDVVDGDQSYAISVSDITTTDEDYEELNVKEKIIITNEDNDDDVGIEFDAKTNLQTSEGGAEATFTVALKSKPTSNVTVILQSTDEDEGELVTDTFLFTTTNWEQPQTVTVKGVDDDNEDGDTTYQIEVDVIDSSDAAYKSYNVANAGSVSIENLDNNSDVGVSFLVNGSLITTETGEQATFDVVLDSEPSADVTITFESSDDTEGEVVTSSVTFTSANWNILQTVTVEGVSDTDTDGAVAYFVTIDEITSADTGYDEYDGIRAGQIDIINQESDEDAGILIDVGAREKDDDGVLETIILETSESGGTATFTIALESQPTAAVYIALGSSNSDEGTVPAQSLTFTASNWDQPQTVTITGADDDGQDAEDDPKDFEDGDVRYTVSVLNVTSDDTRYESIDLAEVDVVKVENIDNDLIEESNEDNGGGGSTGIFMLALGLLIAIRKKVIVKK